MNYLRYWGGLALRMNVDIAIITIAIITSG